MQALSQGEVERGKGKAIKISKSLETPEGEVVFEGTISPDELDFILSVGLNYLMKQGMLPFRVLEQGQQSKVVSGSEEIQ